jgi:hypothetical protein
MHSTLPSKPTDDPCDVVVVESDAVRVAPSDDELSDLLHQAARHRSDSKTSAGLDFTASPTAPPVDTTFRPTAGSSERRPLARRAARAFITLLLAVCMGLTAVAWKSYGDLAKKKIAKLATQVVLATSMPPEKSEPAAQPAPPAVQTSETNTASPQASPVAAQTAPEVTTTADDSSAQSAQLLQSMARDLTSLGQEVEQLKASMEQLKASQQTSRHIADRSERNPRTRTSAPPPRSSAARAHRPVTSYSTSYSPPPIAAAPALPQAAPYYAPPPSRLQQQNTAGLPAEAELSSVPRPPMPVR